MTVALTNVLAHPAISVFFEALFGVHNSEDMIVTEIRFDDTPNRSAVDIETIRDFRLEQCAARGKIRPFDAGIINNGERFPQFITQEVMDLLTIEEESVDYLQAA